jgi:ABC-2 type transport system ATP-binding protein
MAVVVASEAGVRHRRRWVFRGLDVTVAAGETVAVVGPPGSGRTTVLLALVRRFRLSAGTITLSGTASLGHLAGVAEPESVQTVTECVRERLAVLGRPRGEATDLYGLDPGRKAWQLSPYEKQVLGLVLARLGDPAVIALDGVDEGLDAGEQAALWERLAELTAAGIAVIVTARAVEPERVSTVIQLGFEGAATVEEAARETEVPEPAADEPGADEPGADEPGADEPGADEPGADEPGADEAAAEEPGADEAAAEEPATDDSAAEALVAGGDDRRGSHRAERDEDER